MIKIARKATGIILLCIGIQGLAMLILATLIEIGGGELGDMSLKVSQASILYAIFICLVVGGIAMWGWDRWRFVLGIVLIGIGGFTAFACLVSLPAIMRLAKSSNTENMSIYIIAVSLYALIFIVPGITLITLQRKQMVRRQK
jgi:hypothetical protein